MSDNSQNLIAFQGELGANSDTACRHMFPDMTPVPCPTFEDAFNAVDQGKTRLAMIPIENTIAGRVADIHTLLPESDLHIVGEFFLPIHFQLMVLKGASRADIKTVHSHIHALGQCRQYIRANGWEPLIAGDTAGAAKLVAQKGDTS
ncbi:MAG: prephenate dehydratase domain-containing protein, partial [Pseudomonadota bacterium]